jgi:hypothetical protein
LFKNNKRFEKLKLSQIFTVSGNILNLTQTTFPAIFGLWCFLPRMAGVGS